MPMAQNPAGLHPDRTKRPRPHRPALIATPGASEWISRVSSPSICPELKSAMFATVSARARSNAVARGVHRCDREITSRASKCGIRLTLSGGPRHPRWKARPYQEFVKATSKAPVITLHEGLPGRPTPMSVKVRVAACTRIFRNARTDGTRRRGAGIFGGTGDFPGITLDLFNWVHGQRCAGGFAKLMVGGAAHRRRSSGSVSEIRSPRSSSPISWEATPKRSPPTFVSVAGGHDGRRCAYSWG